MNKRSKKKRLKRIIKAASFAIAMTAFSAAVYATQLKEVSINYLGENISFKTVASTVSEALKEIKPELDAEVEKIVYKLEEKEDEFDIKIEKGIYLVTGRAIEKLLGRVNMADNESLYYFTKMLNKLGIEQKLKEMGVKEGDVVKFMEWEFEWYE